MDIYEEDILIQIFQGTNWKIVMGVMIFGLLRRIH
jgi:hypothetical protein